MTDLTRDDFLGGRLRLYQPANGYRAGVDPVLLAAATPIKSGETLLELGCGVGAASLCAATRVAGIRATGIELQPDYADLARRNAAENDLPFDVITADLRALPADIRNTQFDHVIMNPPYYLRDASTPATDKGRDTALGGDTPLADWITIGAKRIAPRGYLTLIQRIDRLPETVAVVHSLLGSIVIQPIAPRQGRESGLFILSARKNGRAAFKLRPPLVMHDGVAHTADGESYTTVVKSILRDGAELRLF
ncbi:methyltransferase [Marivivens niveibacter]|uniref:Methyltransferase n=1 Tax=Marivivens niveibacter TaxID=1930667 RepID=A0A251X037_9RHOB|nr:methyltransferase domain-containing protein [Marivivens niveibacter]OUD10057.1 methyltransferase [Marivivens niveibacter]